MGHAPSARAQVVGHANIPSNVPTSIIPVVRNPGVPRTKSTSLGLGIFGSEDSTARLTRTCSHARMRHHTEKTSTCIARSDHVLVLSAGRWFVKIWSSGPTFATRSVGASWNVVMRRAWKAGCWWVWYGEIRSREMQRTHVCVSEWTD